MKLKPRKYTASNLTVGIIILLMSLNWVYQNIRTYYFWNFTRGWRCGNGMPTNAELILQILLGSAGVYLSTRVIENKFRPVFGVLFQFMLVCVGVYLEIVRVSRW